MKLQVLRCDIQAGVDSLDNGQGKPLDMEVIKTRGRKIMAQKDKS